MFMSLMTKKIIYHLQWVKMKTSELIVKIMNTYGQEKIVDKSGLELACEVAKPFERIGKMEGSNMNTLSQDEVKPPHDKEEIKKLVS